MHAIKIYAVPADPAAAIAAWREIGLDTIMAGRDCLADLSFMAQVRSAGLRYSIIEPIFLLDDDAPAEALALGCDGQPAVDDWVRFACPGNSDGQRRILERLAADAALGPDGMSLDFIRFFAFWENVPPYAKPESLPRTCYCPDCVASLADFAALSAPSLHGSRAEQARQAASWVDALDPEVVGRWRTGVITSLVSRASSLIRSIDPAIRIGLHTVPWLRDDFGGARRQLLGQDLEALAPLVDYFTPMAYHQMVRQEPEWIARLVEDHRVSGAGIPVVPCVQVRPYYNETPLGADAFQEAVRVALRQPSAGLACFCWNDLEAEPAKLTMMRQELQKNLTYGGKS